MIRGDLHGTTVYGDEFLRVRPVKVARKLANGIFQSKDDREYADDVLGKSPYGKYRFRKKITASLKKFKKLADDYPIELVAGSKDEICRICVLGDHCQQTKESPKFDGNSTRFDRDNKEVQRFIDTARRLGLGSEIKVFSGVTDFSDAENMEYDAVRVTAGIARRVLANIR